MGSFSATDRLWFFHRRYIDKVLEELPGRRFGVLVYSNNLTPPRIETVHPAMATSTWQNLSMGASTE